MMDKLPLVSIIVPVYNAEKYLDRCVESLIKQTYKNVEIILVDDGSKDSSGKLCDEYEEKIDNVKVIHQENAGDSAARNAGVRIAEGEFVFFVDADDYSPYESVEQLIKEQMVQNADIVIGMVNTEPIEKRESIAMTSCDMALFCINQKQYMVENEMPEFVNFINPGSQCMKIIRKSIIIDKNVWFNEKVRMHHQDTLFSMLLYSKTNNIVLLNVPTYYYDVDIPGSMRKQLNPNKLKEAYTLVSSMKDIIEMYEIDTQQKQKLIEEFYIYILYECWSEYFTHADNHSSVKIRYQELKELKKCFQEIIEFDKIEKVDISSYPKYQQYIIKLLLNTNFKILCMIAVLWSRYKGIKND